MARAPTRTVVPTRETSLAYHVFAGELAVQRGDSRTAAHEYAQAARLGTDPALAAQATLVAYHAHADQLALTASRRWLQLAPNDEAALRVAAVLNARLGHVQEAVAESRRLLKTAPAGEVVLLGQMFEQEASPSLGLPVMQQLAAAYPDSAEAHYALAHIALQAQQSALALREAGVAAKLKPKWNPAVILEADALRAQGRTPAALKLLRARQRSAPRDLDLHLAYATLLAQAGETAHARTEFNAILKSTPRNPDALYSLGLLALQDKQPDSARAYFTQLLDTGQRNNEAFYFLGNTAAASRLYAEALKWYQQVDGGHYWFPAQIATARMMLADGKPEEARGYLDSLVAADPEDGAQFRLQEAQLFSSTGDTRSALATFAQALAEYPGNADLLYARALLRESLGRVADAESDLRMALVSEPDDASVLNALGYILTVHTTRFQEARDYIEKALRLRPDDPAILDSLGWVEFRMGEHARAVSELRDAYARSTDPEIAAHLTEALWAAGDQQAARNVWAHALAQHPQNPTLLKLNARFVR